MGRYRRILTGFTVFTFAVGMVELLSGMLADGRFDANDARTFGSLLIIVALACAAFRLALMPWQRAYERGCRNGYQDGYRDALAGRHSEL